MLQELQALHQAHLLSATMARALGTEMDLPDWDEWREEFHAHLVAPPAQVIEPDGDRAVLMRSLNLRR